MKDAKVFGVALVRNEADIIRPNVLHHLALGLDRILVVDNGSTDGTDEILRDLAADDERVSWTRDDSAFDQVRITTELAREALRQGADWVLPFDADEFWISERRSFRKVLENSDAGALKVPIINFVQAREQRESKPEALLTMTHRVAEPVGPGKFCRPLIESQEIAFVEMAYPGKWIFRPRPEVEVMRGNHKVVGVNGPREECAEIVCLHAPLRSRDSLEAKAEQGRRLDEAGVPQDSAWNHRRWARLQDESLDDEWAANSHKDGVLDAYDRTLELVPDHRLRDAVAPLLSMPKRPRGSLLQRLVRRR